MKHLSRIAACTLVVLLYLAGCGLLSPGPVPIYQTTSAQMAVALPGVVSPMGLSAGSAADVVSMAAVVAGKDIFGVYQDPLVIGELTLEGDGVWRVTIADLPIGPALTFTVRGYDAADEEIFSGVTVQPLTGAGDTVSVDLEPIADAVLITFPVITQISRAAEIENGSLGNPVSVDVRGSADEPLSYSFTSGGGSFMPESGTVDFPGSGVGAFVSGYDAPAEIGEYYHGVRVTNSQGNAVTTDFLTMVVYGTTPVTMEMSFAPSVIGLSAQRIGNGVRWEASVNDDGSQAELTYLWEYDGGLGFIDPTGNPAELSGYEETATGTITLTVTDGSGAGLSTTVSFLLAAGQFPDTLSVDVALAVNYTANGAYQGSVPTDSHNYNVGQEVEVLGNPGELSRNGYVLVGWNTEEDGSGVTYTMGQIFFMANADVTLYAVWEMNAAEVPMISSAATADVDADGMIDRLTITFDKDVVINSTPRVVFNFHIIAYYEYAAGPTMTLVLNLVESGNPNTDDTSDVTFTSDGSVTDSMSGFDARDYGPTAATDGAGPAVVSAQTVTTTTAEVTFSEAVIDASVDAADFMFSGFSTPAANAAGTGFSTGDVPNDAIVVIGLAAEIDPSEAGYVALSAGAVTEAAGTANTSTQTAAVEVTDGIVMPWPPTTSLFEINEGAPFARSIDATLSNSVPGAARMQVSNDGSTWSTWEPYASSKSWSLPSGDGLKRVYARFSNEAGNTIALAAFIYLDTTAPIVESLLINNGASTTTSQNVVITSSVFGASSMRLSDDGTNWSSWEAFRATKGWILRPDEGAKTVYAQYEDAAGNRSERTASIDLDTTAPEITYFRVNDGTVATSSRYTTVNSKVTGATYMRFSNSRSSWPGWEEYAESRDWTLTSGDMGKYVFAQYRDDARNVAETFDRITLDSVPPVVAYLRIDEGASTTASYDVTISHSVTDDNAILMRFSNNGIDWSDWAAYMPSTSWTLAAGEGRKTVYAEYKDIALNTVGKTAEITVDTPPVVSYFRIKDGAAGTTSRFVSLNMSVAGATRMRFSNDGFEWSEYPYADLKGWELAPGEGLHVVYARFYDDTGNVAYDSDFITLDEYRSVWITLEKIHVIEDGDDLSSGDLYWSMTYKRMDDSSWTVVHERDRYDTIAVDNGDTVQIDEYKFFDMLRDPHNYYDMRIRVGENDVGSPDLTNVYTERYRFDSWGIDSESYSVILEGDQVKVEVYWRIQQADWTGVPSN
jgi:uncharacterized repeat protein (TIGR02543 family)